MFLSIAVIKDVRYTLIWSLMLFLADQKEMKLLSAESETLKPNMEGKPRTVSAPPGKPGRPSVPVHRGRGSHPDAVSLSPTRRGRPGLAAAS